MRIKGYKRIKNHILYFRKDHFCPDCKAKLEKVAVSKVVNSRSPEAKDFDFDMFGSYAVGDVKFTWDEFECPNCKKHLTVLDKYVIVDDTSKGVYFLCAFFATAPVGRKA